MLQLMSLPLGQTTLLEYPDLSAACAAVGCDGVEGIWSGEDFPPELPRECCIGYHLTFYPDWLDFWNEDVPALRRKFGSDDVWQSFYGGSRRQCLVEYYREDLHRAAALGARYVVFHVSDVSIEEGFTYRWLHSSRAVIDAAAELLNQLFDGWTPGIRLLVENQWWPGFTFTEPELTRRLLDGIRYPCKGIMLDTGHLMNCNPALRTQEDGAAYLHRMLDEHGDLARAVCGVHLHQSLSGEFVQSHTGTLPEDLPRDYQARYAAGYGQILQIDRHEPWTSPAIASVIGRIGPDYLVHELSAADRPQRERRICIQRAALQKTVDNTGGL